MVKLEKTFSEVKTMAYDLTNSRFETVQLHAGQENPDSATGARAVPIYQSSSYVFRSCDHAAALFDLSQEGDVYSRMSNPTQAVFEKRIAALEGGVGAVATASGMAAVSYAVQALAHCGEHIVAANNIYGGTYSLFEHTLRDYGISTTFVSPFDYDSVEKSIRENTRLLYVETLGNPCCEVSNIERLSEIAHRHNIPLVIDSTFATPYLLRPFEHGADIVVHSATKFIGGHGTTIGGIIVDSGNFDWKKSGKFPQMVEPNEAYHGVSFTESAGKGAYLALVRAILLRDFGAALSPVHAFVFLQGLETLSLRVERHVENALRVVEYLKSCPFVEEVHHPSVSQDAEQQELYKKYFPKGAGSIFTVDIKGGKEETKKFVDSLRLFSLLANVADVKSLVIHPASTTHAQMNEKELLECGIKPNTIRLSIGTEHIDDIIADLEQAFECMK